jgi:hypothetical protein
MLIPSNQKFFFTMILPMASQMWRKFSSKQSRNCSPLEQLPYWNQTHLVSYVAPKTNLEELKSEFVHTTGEIPIDEVLTHSKVQDLKIIRWTLQKDV